MEEALLTQSVGMVQIGIPRLSKSIPVSTNVIFVSGIPLQLKKIKTRKEALLVEWKYNFIFNKY